MTGFRFWRTREFGTALVLIAMLVAFEIASQVNTRSSFLLSGQLPRLLQDASFVGIAAIGACMVIISGGVDLAAKAELQAIVRELARGGTAVILISSELEEVRQMADRILVFRSGRVAGEFPGAGATDQQLMSAAT